MRQLLLIIFILSTLNSFSQKLEITTIDKSKITATLLDSTSTSNLLTQFNGRQDNTLRKKWTARTFLLSDGKVVIEFYDKQALLINDVENFKKLERVRFVKNTNWFLKKNISYKIELTFEEGNNIVKTEKPKRLKNFKSDMPEYFDFEVYQLNNGQLLFIDKSRNFKSATIYPDLKTLSSDNLSIEDQVYGSDDEEHLMKKIANGDSLADYDPREYSIYQKYEKALIKNHKLTLIETNVFVENYFHGNLYKSENGYYILLDEFNQLNLGKTAKINIGTLRVYSNIEELRAAQKRYKESKDKKVIDNHFYQQISNAYGQNFPNFVLALIDSLPKLLNFDKEQLSIDSVDLELIDETLKWNGTNYKLFDSWFPSVLAFYGQTYIAEKKEGKWTMQYDKEDQVWIPEIILNDGLPAWDWGDFYKAMYEGPIPLKWAGNWDGNNR